MMSNKGNAGRLDRCPYDISHQVSKARLALHIVKCRRNHPDAKLTDCPFDKSHMIPEVELQYHIETCVSRVNLDKFVTEPQDVDMEKYNPPILDVKRTENWDDEETVPAYNPQEYCEKNVILRNQMQTHSSAKRRDFRMQERSRIQQLMAAQPPEQPAQAEENKCRRPVAESESNHLECVHEEAPPAVKELMEKVKKGAKTVVVPQVAFNFPNANGYYDHYDNTNNNMQLNNEKEYPALEKPKSAGIWNRNYFPMKGIYSAPIKKKGRGRGSALAIH